MGVVLRSSKDSVTFFPLPRSLISGSPPAICFWHGGMLSWRVAGRYLPMLSFAYSTHHLSPVPAFVLTPLVLLVWHWVVLVTLIPGALGRVPACNPWALSSLAVPVTSGLLRHRLHAGTRAFILFLSRLISSQEPPRLWFM